MEAVVFIILQISFATCVVLIIGKYHFQGYLPVLVGELAGKYSVM